MKYVLGLLLFFSVSFAITLAWANCNQTIDVDQVKRLPVEIPLFGGMKCGEFEKHRGELYWGELSEVTSESFNNYAKWKVSYDSTRLRLIEAQDKLHTARLADASDNAKSIAITALLVTVGNSFTLLGCNTPVTLPTIISCAGGISITGFGFLYSMTTSNFNANASKAEAVLNEIRITLEEAENLGDNILPDIKQRYYAQLNYMCSLVKAHCL